MQAIPVTPAAPFDRSCQATGIFQTDRERWLAARRQGLGGSEVAAILGIHPYKSALEVYADKVGAMPANDRVAEVALWGQLFEGPIVEEFARRTGRDVVRSNELLRSRSRPWQTVTPDATIFSGIPKGCDGPGLGEVKTTGFGDWTEAIPAHVLTQVQHGLAVTGAEWATLVWLPFPERKLEWRDLRPHAEFQALLLERVDEFWSRVCERRPPNADGSDSARRALFALDPELAEECVELEDAAAIADELEEILATQKRLEARKDLISNRILQVLGPYKIGLVDDGRYWNSWITEARVENCAHCGGTTRQVAGFRACRLMQPRKKPHTRALETRRVDLDLDDELAALIKASTEGRAS